MGTEAGASPSLTVESQSVLVDGVRDVRLVASSSLEQLLFNRSLMGLDFIRTCRECSYDMLRAVAQELGDRVSIPTELVVLSKGACYQIADAYGRLLGVAPNVSFIATRRERVRGGLAKISVPYQCLGAPTDYLLIGDTIASGSTICAALESYMKRQVVRRVVLFSFAGGLPGIRRIDQFCSARNIEATFVLGLAAFGLGSNGFDLSFLHADTIASDRYRERASQLFDGKPVSSVGWDFGSQGYAPEKYKLLSWIESKYWNLESCPEFAFAEPTGEIGLVAAEHDAFRSKFPDLQTIMPSKAKFSKESAAQTG